jgi:glycosyltransferase involved in cell wall biosynthesis
MTPKKNIVFVERNNFGGLAHYAHEVCSALAHEGHKITLICFGRFEVPLQLRNYDTIEFPYKQSATRIGKGILNIKYAFYTLSTICKTNPDAVFLNGYQPMFSLPIAIFRPRTVPIFCIQHEVEPRIGNKHISFFQKYFYKIVTAMIVHRNTYSKDLLKIKYKVRSSILTINLGLFTTDLFGKETVEYNHKKTTILSFGTVRPDKGLDLLVKAYPGRSQCGDLYLQIAGQANKKYGEYFTKVIADKKNIYWNRNFISTSKIGSIYNNASFVVLPFLECTQSASLRLAMFFETPVIASDVGEIPAFLEKYQVGIMVPRGNIEALRQAMITLATSPDKRNKYKANIKYLNSRSEMSWQTILRELFDEISERKLW